jgi:N-methylhydantoinase B
MSTLGEIEFQLMWNRLLAVVEEQGQALIRTAFSSMVRECGDISAGVFDTHGRMLAQAVTGTPGHVNTMAASVGHFLERFPLDTMQDGDAYLTNDPWLGTGHLNDLVVCAPVFHGDRAVALVACTGHLIDIGGIGFGPDGTDVFMEGLNIPMLKLVDRGRLNQVFIEILKANSRLPTDSEGDVYSLVACCDTGKRRLREMLDEFGRADLQELGDRIIERSRAAVRKQVALLPRGTYLNELMIDGYDSPLTLRASLTIGEQGINVDFAGSPAAVRFGINVPITYTRAYATFALSCVVAPGVPNNAGSLEVFSVDAPSGTILNAPRPHAVAVRHVIGQILPDLVFGCLRQAVPDRVPAEGTSALWNLILRSVPGDGKDFMLMAATNGGTGGRPRLDGLSATAFPSGVRGTPMEVLESIAPVVIWRKELRGDSGGAGAYRGGLGQEIEVAHRYGQSMELLAAYDRIQCPPRGVNGGRNGAAGYVGLDSGEALAGKGAQIIPSGRRLVIRTPGGGGWGDPRQRPGAMVAADVRQGLVTAAAAAKDYGFEG